MKVIGKRKNRWVLLGVWGLWIGAFGLPTTPLSVSAYSMGRADSSQQQVKELIRRQKAELKDLVHRNQAELAALKASQEVQRKEWEKKERESRHQYFAEHTHGPERRAYVKDFLSRREAFLKAQKDERTRRSQEQADQVKALQQDQAEKLKSFKEAVERGETPAENLWPKS